MRTSDEPWWLEGNYAPVSKEVTAERLEVTGAIPPELDGLYVRNGSNAPHADNRHWFTGQGMVHGVRLCRGRALWYRNRWVRTPLLARPRGAPPAPPTLTDTASNVAVVYHGGTLLSRGEVGLPYELSPYDLSTLGAHDFGGRLRTYMTAHPKLDPRSGELLMFGYSFFAPHLTYHEVGARGALERSLTIDLPRPSLVHDFAMTANYVVFMDLPVAFRLDLALRGDAFPFRWNDDHVPRLGVLPRHRARASVRWFEVDPCFVFHVMNAFEDPSEPDVIALDVVRYERLWDDSATRLDAQAALTRFRLRLADGSVHERALDDRAIELPQIDARRTGQPYRYGYALELRPGQGGRPGTVRAALKYDHARGSASAHEFPPEQQSDEVLFVPAAPGAGEDEGYLLSYVYDRSTRQSALVILDASDLRRPPLARVALPQRVPFGFHAAWVPVG